MKINKRLDVKIQIGIFIGCIFLVGLLAFADNINLKIESEFFQKTIPFINAILNSIVFLLISFGIFAIKFQNPKLHKSCMRWAIILSGIFLMLFIIHVLFAGIIKYGDLNLDGILSPEEEQKIESTQFIYYFILSSHIILASLFLPFIILTAYKGFIEDYDVIVPTSQNQISIEKDLKKYL